jgi:chemotaxis protein MotB
MRRRITNPGSFNVWPAFTDVLGGLVVVLIFLITIFVIGEVLIGRELTGKDTAIDQLARIIDGLEAAVGESSTKNERLQRTVDDLSRDIGLMEDELRDAHADRDTLDKALASAVNTQTELGQSLQRKTVALHEAQSAQAKADLEVVASARRMAALTARTKELAAQLEKLNLALYGSRAELEAADTRTLEMVATIGAQAAELERREDLLSTQSDRLEEMDTLIKRHLLDKVEELEKYSSDFFGRLRNVFADNPDIKMVGDRFVFQSEVLFPSGAASLTIGGRDDLDKFAEVYRQVESRLPPDLPVIIEVLGHTDRIPIHNDKFESNWELSFHRALGVVDYLISRGVPPQRLAAVGMGEYHPIVGGGDPGTLRKNRRIELKITSR